MALMITRAGPAFGASPFTPGNVFWAPGSCPAVCELFDVTAGGDFGAADGLATINRSPGQIAWSQDLSRAYVSEFFQNQVSKISAAGEVSTFATGIIRPTGLLRRTDGHLLVASFSNGAVYDISGGGDFSTATAFATGLGGARNLLQLATGEILLADQNGGRVIDITSGGHFAAANGFAFGFPATAPLDLVQDASGRIYASSFSGVFDITDGGDVSGASPHATGLDFIGLTVAGDGKLLASVLITGDVYDITSGGDVSASSPFASNLRGFGDTALDAVPESTPQAVPALTAGSWWALASLLLLAGAMLASERAAGSDRRVRT